MFFLVGVEAGFYTLPNLKERLPDGQPKVTLADVCDVNEYIEVKQEIERRAHAAHDRKQELQSARRPR